MHKLILASQSPRRRMLLKKLGFKFQTRSIEISEFLDKNLNLKSAIQKIARQKAVALMRTAKELKGRPFIILSGDTLVVVDGKVLGKPKSRGQAKRFLGLLSGQVHQVMTAICFLDCVTGKAHVRIRVSRVKFRDLSQSEIQDYVLSGEPMDKAGAYGIQGAGGKFISWHTGTLENIMGLPIDLVAAMIKKHGWKFERNNFRDQRKNSK